VPAPLAASPVDGRRAPAAPDAAPASTRPRERTTTSLGRARISSPIAPTNSVPEELPRPPSPALPPPAPVGPSAASAAQVPTSAPSELAPPTAPSPTPPSAREPAAALSASDLAVETSMLGEALTLLRRQHDASGALGVLDAYEARFPRGTLHREASVARVDALLLLGRDADALGVLRELALQPRGRDQELRVIRGELASPTSCAAAVADFDRVLTEAPAPALVERTLHGRAACLARLGDAEGARRDLTQYLRLFPQGRFAPEARRSLSGE
jgi:hypothetical protein